MELLVITEKFKELIKKRKEIISKKKKFIESSDYEKAARYRDDERHVRDCIINEFPNSKELLDTEDVEFWRLLDNVDENDIDFSNAINKCIKENALRAKISLRLNSYEQKGKGMVSINELKKQLEELLKEINDFEK